MLSLKESNDVIIDLIKNEKPFSVTRLGNAISLLSINYDKNKNNNLLIFNDFNSEIKKTKEMSLIIKKFEISNALIILDSVSRKNIERAARNIPNIKVTDVNHFSAFDVIKFKKIVFTESSVKELEKRYT